LSLQYLFDVVWQHLLIRLKLGGKSLGQGSEFSDSIEDDREASPAHSYFD